MSCSGRRPESSAAQLLPWEAWPSWAGGVGGEGDSGRLGSRRSSGVQCSGEEGMWPPLGLRFGREAGGPGAGAGGPPDQQPLTLPAVRPRFAKGSPTVLAQPCKALKVPLAQGAARP